jgi:Flp pilus assembly protein TadD
MIRLERMMKLPALILSLTLLSGCSMSAGPFIFWSSADATSVGMTESERLYQDGLNAFQHTDYGLAQQKFQASVEANPKFAVAWLGLAGSYDQLRRFDLADRAYQEVERLTGPTASLLNNRGYSQFLRGDLNKARGFYASALRLAPGDATIINNIAMVDARRN